MDLTERTEVVRPVCDALRLLRAVGAVDRDLSEAEIRSLTSLPGPVVTDALAAFEQSGVLRRDPDQGTYRLGLAMWRLATRSEATSATQTLPMMAG